MYFHGELRKIPIFLGCKKKQQKTKLKQKQKQPYLELWFIAASWRSAFGHYLTVDLNSLVRHCVNRKALTRLSRVLSLRCSCIRWLSHDAAHFFCVWLENDDIDCSSPCLIWTAWNGFYPLFIHESVQFKELTCCTPQYSRPRLTWSFNSGLSLFTLTSSIIWENK